MRLSKIFFLILLAFSGRLFPQKEVKKASKSYAHFDYAKVIEMIDKKENLDMDMMRKLADSYKMTGEYKEAESCYEIIANDENRTAADVYAYAQVLKMNSKYEEAARQMDLFTGLKPDDSRVELYQINKKYTGELLKDNRQFDIKNIAGNSSQQDFGVVYFKNKIVLTSSRQDLEYITMLWNGNKLPFLDLYTAKITPKNELKSFRKIKSLNKKYHEGPASFNKKGNMIVFTSDNYHGKSNDGVKNLKLYEARFDKGEWVDKESFPYNHDDYSCGHPALSPDGNTMYFASDMPGGFGGVDIYKTTREENGKWTKPVNLGEKINTEGNEMFPFVHESGLFFFSSDGRPGLGGLDIFAAQILNDQISKVINPGIPLNGSKDDFSMVIDGEKKHGFFSSNRDGGKGSDDIYAYDLLKPFNFGKIIKGHVKDHNGNPIHEAAIYLTDKPGRILDKVCTAKDGSYLMFADEGKEYKVVAKKEKHFEIKKNLNTGVPDEVISIDFKLEKDPGFSLYALITDKKTKQPLEGVKLTLKQDRIKPVEAVTPLSGEFKMNLPDKKLGDTLKYMIEISKKGYVSKTIDFKWPLKKPGQQNIHEKLDIQLSKVEVGGDLSKMTSLGNIYYDFGKWDIRPDAAAELDKIVKIMNENPDMVVELGSHTDCRSSRLYNLKLSDKRAKASVTYIQKRISDPKRITGKGYGESKLLNSCACEGKLESSCSDEEHQKNRRTEFIILKLGVK
jgi:outer membrane protein OmpA-like peptidoglycan-associated protein